MFSSGLNIFGLNFGLLYPALFFVVLPAGLALLVYAYLKKGRGKRIEVASLMFLKQIQSIPQSRRKFLPPLKFFFELLLLLLLLLAAAGLYENKAGDRVAMLIDNSPSMSASDLLDVSSKDFLLQAKQKAIDDLQSLPQNSLIEIFTTSPNLASLSQGMIDKTSAISAVDKISTGFSPDNIESTLENIQTQGKFSRIYAFTDAVEITESVGDNNLSKEISIRNINQNFDKKAPENIAISSISLKKDGMNGGKLNLNADISSFTSSNTEVKVVISAVISSEDPERLSAVGEKNIGLKAQETKAINFDGLSADMPAYRLEVKELKKPGQASRNLVSSDDSAWVTPQIELGKIAFVGNLKSSELGLSQINTLKFSNFSPGEYEQNNSQILKDNFKAIIFHRYVPEKLPSTNAFFIFPDRNNSLFTVTGDNQSAEVTRWAASNPLLSYLNLPGLKIDTFENIKLPEWGEDVISTSKGSALIAGEYQGQRYLISAFEILPYEARRSPLMSVLTLNSLKWLTDLSGNFGYQNAGSTYEITNETESISFQDGNVLYTNSQKPETKSIRFERPGLYKVKNKNARVVLFAVNFFSFDESNLLQKRFVALPQAKVEKKDDLEGSTNLARFLAMASLILICLELLILLLRNFKRIAYRTN